MNPLDPCVKELGLFGDPHLGDFEIYELQRCRELRQLEARFQDMEIRVIVGYYVDLASTAKAFACLHRSTVEAARFYLRDWTEFRRLARLWETVLLNAERTLTGA